MTKFSVVIAVYNKAEFIADTIHSVLAQTMKNFELVIVNDGSTDGSEQAIAEIKDSRINYISQPNQGASAARNTGIANASHSYIAFLDADDHWLPSHLETLSSLINEFPKEKVFACNSVLIKNKKTLKKNYSTPLTNQPVVVNFFEASMLDSITHSSTIAIHADIFNLIGLYDPKLESGEDTDLYIRIGLINQIVFHPKITVQIRRSQNSLMLKTQTIQQKPTFSQYEKLESKHPGLKKFLDQNRYSLCILAKRTGNKAAFQDNLKKIDLDNLNEKQRRILKLPGSLIRVLHALKRKAARFGIRPVLRN